MDGYRYTFTAWVDGFKSWRAGLAKKVQAGQDVAVDLLAGATLLAEAARRANHPDSRPLQEWADRSALPTSATF